MRAYADDKIEMTGELLKVFKQLGNQGEYHIRSGLQAATSSLSRWPGKDCRRRRAPGGRCRACFMTRRPCAQRAQGAAAEGGAEVGACAAVWVAFVILYIVIWGGIQDSELLIFWFFWFF